MIAAGPQQQRLRCLTTVWLITVTACCATGSRADALTASPQPTSLLCALAQPHPGAPDTSAAAASDDNRRSVTEDEPAVADTPWATRPATAGARQRLAVGLFLWLGMVLGLVGLGACVLLMARRRQRK